MKAERRTAKPIGQRCGHIRNGERSVTAGCQMTVDKKCLKLQIAKSKNEGCRACYSTALLQLLALCGFAPLRKTLLDEESPERHDASLSSCVKRFVVTLQ